MVESSPKAIMQLAGDIAKGIQQINAFNADIESQLKALGVTFRDEGFSEVCQYVAKSKSGIENAMPDLNTVIKNLIEYAEYLKVSKQTL